MFCQTDFLMFHEAKDISQKYFTGLPNQELASLHTMVSGTILRMGYLVVQPFLICQETILVCSEKQAWHPTINEFSHCFTSIDLPLEDPQEVLLHDQGEIFFFLYAVSESHPLIPYFVRDSGLSRRWQYHDLIRSFCCRQFPLRNRTQRLHLYCTITLHGPCFS